MRRFSDRSPARQTWAASSPLWGGVGGGLGLDSRPHRVRTTPLPVPPPQGGRERCGASLRNLADTLAERSRPRRTASCGTHVCYDDPSPAQDNFFAASHQARHRLDAGRRLRRLCAAAGAPLREAHSGQSDDRAAEHAGRRHAAPPTISPVAPKDGTAIGTIVSSARLDQAMGDPGVSFDAANSTGSAIPPTTCAAAWERPARHARRLRCRADCSAATRRGTDLACFRSSSTTRRHQIKIIRLSGRTPIILAMERGEVELHRRHDLGGGEGDDAADARIAQGQRAAAMGRPSRTRRFPTYARREMPVIHDTARTISTGGC